MFQVKKKNQVHFFFQFKSFFLKKDCPLKPFDANSQYQLRGLSVKNSSLPNNPHDVISSFPNLYYYHAPTCRNLITSLFLTTFFTLGRFDFILNPIIDRYFHEADVEILPCTVGFFGRQWTFDGSALFSAKGTQGGGRSGSELNCNILHPLFAGSQTSGQILSKVCFF